MFPDQLLEEQDLLVREGVKKSLELNCSLLEGRGGALLALAQQCDVKRKIL